MPHTNTGANRLNRARDEELDENGRASAERRTVGTQKLQEKAGEVKRNIQELGGAARDMAQEQLGSLRETASEFMHQGREKCHAMEDSLESQIRGKPLQSILIACGLGFLIGAWLRR